LGAKPSLVQRIEPSGYTHLDDLPNVLRGAASAAFSPAGDLLAWSEVDNSQLFVEVWDLRNGRERARLPDEEVVSFSSDGRRIATKGFGSNGRITVTDLSSGYRERKTALPWPRSATSGYSPAENSSPETPGKSDWQVTNGRGLGASISGDGTLTLWDTDRARQIAQIGIEAKPDGAALAFDATGARLAVAASGGDTSVVDVDPASWRTRACKLAARVLTAPEKSTFLGPVQLPSSCP
jgi:WD40 repeat protein